MRLLPIRSDHECGSTASAQGQSYRSGNRPGTRRKHLPVRNILPNPACSTSRGRTGERREMNNNRLLNRREFLKVGVAAGGGILIGIYLPQFNSLEAGSAGQFHPNAFLRIAADDVITVILGKSEMGTGIYTALPMMLVEELDAAWENVRVEAAPA